jgi:hypothetical protein
VQQATVKLVGKGNAELALSLVGYSEELKVGWLPAQSTKNLIHLQFCIIY